MEIASLIYIDKQMLKDVAKQYRVSVARVGMLLTKVKKKPDILDILA